MSVVSKLKKLHKQFLLKIDNIQRAMIAKAAGVDNEEYLSRARTLKDFLNPQKAESPEEVQTPETEETEVKAESATETPQPTASKSRTKKPAVTKEYEL